MEIIVAIFFWLACAAGHHFAVFPAVAWTLWGVLVIWIPVRAPEDDQ